jgi:D-xylose transport system permease protein
MTDTSNLQPSPTSPVSSRGWFARFLRATEIDQAFLGRVGALLLIWLGFHLYGAVFLGEGLFLTPRNLWNLSVQTAYIGIMATGMVLIIIMREIDLSIGAIMGFVGVVMGLMQVEWLGPLFGLGHPAIWIVTVVCGIAMGAAIGAFQGVLIAYLSIPSFIVTLGGLLVWRGAAFVSSGSTIAPMDTTFVLLGGAGPFAALGTAGSWILAAAACLAVLWITRVGRSARRLHGFSPRPLWAEAIVAGTASAVILGSAAVVNAYYWAPGNLKIYFDKQKLPVPEGAEFGHGFAYPLLLMVVITVGMTVLMNRTRFGRYVFAIGGNPEAASLSGINTRAMKVKVFALMGALAGVAAIIGSARQNSATNAMGVFDELYVIAAAVIGGTSLAGGVGTIYGAIIGALVLVSLQTGMVLIGFGDGSYQRMVTGVALVLAVWLDIVYRKRFK